MYILSFLSIIYSKNETLIKKHLYPNLRVGMNVFRDEQRIVVNLAIRWKLIEYITIFFKNFKYSKNLLNSINDRSVYHVINIDL